MSKTIPTFMSVWHIWNEHAAHCRSHGRKYHYFNDYFETFYATCSMPRWHRTVVTGDVASAERKVSSLFSGNGPEKIPAHGTCIYISPGSISSVWNNAVTRQFSDISKSNYMKRNSCFPWRTLYMGEDVVRSVKLYNSVGSIGFHFSGYSQDIIINDIG